MTTNTNRQEKHTHLAFTAKRQITHRRIVSSERRKKQENRKIQDHLNRTIKDRNVKNTNVRNINANHSEEDSKTPEDIAEEVKDTEEEREDHMSTSLTTNKVITTDKVNLRKPPKESKNHEHPKYELQQLTKAAKASTHRTNLHFR